MPNRAPNNTFKLKAAGASGYSGTPLAKKLGIKEASRVFATGAPREYRRSLEPLPTGVRFETHPGPRVDIAHVFVTQKEELAKCLATLRAKLKPDAALWVSWPKKTARVSTTVGENVIRELALPFGFVDVKVCAVNEVWSGLKLVVRKKLR